MARAAAAAGFLWPYLLWRHPQARWREQLRLPSNAHVAAAAGGHLEVLTFLLGQGGADAKEEDGTTPLMAAAEAGSVECVGKLLEGLTLTLTLTLTPTLTLPLTLTLMHAPGGELGLRRGRPSPAPERTSERPRRPLPRAPPAPSYPSMEEYAQMTGCAKP